MNVIIVNKKGILETPILVKDISTAEATFDNISKKLLGTDFETIEAVDYGVRLTEVNQLLEGTGISISWFEELEINYFNSNDELKEFPNGYSSWHETHFEIVQAITEQLNNTDNNIIDIYEEQGTGGMYELAEKLTNEFEALYLNKEWDGEFFGSIEKFMTEFLNKTEPKNEAVFIKFLNKDKSFKEDKISFKGLNAYYAAKEWGKSNLDNFNIDMIIYE